MFVLVACLCVAVMRHIFWVCVFVYTFIGLLFLLVALMIICVEVVVIL